MNCFSIARLYCFVGCCIWLATGCQDVDMVDDPTVNTVFTDHESPKVTDSDEVKVLLETKRTAVCSQEAVTSIDSDLESVSQWICGAIDSETDSNQAFTVDQLKWIQTGLQARREIVIQALILEALHEAEIALIREATPTALKTLEHAAGERAEWDKPRTEQNEHSNSAQNVGPAKEYRCRADIIARLEQLQDEATSDDLVKELIVHANAVLESFSEDDFQRESEIVMQQASRKSRSVNEMIELQSKAMKLLLEEHGNRISEESKKRWSQTSMAIHRFVWSQLSDVEKQAIGKLYFEYVVQQREQAERLGELEAATETLASREIKLPSSADLRVCLMNVINAKVNQESNMRRVASDIAVSGFSFENRGEQDVLRIASAEEEIKLLVKIHGVNLAPAFAELCFDPEEEIASMAANRLNSLGDSAIEILSVEATDPAQATLQRFALVKAFRRQAPKIAPTLLWPEVIGKTRFGEVALQELTNLPNGVDLDTDQMRFLAEGIRSEDKTRSQDCLIIARKANSLDDGMLDAIEQKALSSGYLAEMAIDILSKHHERGRRTSLNLIRRLSTATTARYFGRDDTAHVRVQLASQIRMFKPDAKDLAPLVSKLADPSESHEVRRAISDLFYDAGQESLSPVIAALGDSSTSKEGRHELLKSLGMIRVASRSVLLELERWVKSSDQRERTIAIDSLRVIGADAASSVNALLEATKDPQTGDKAMNALVSIIRDPDEAMMRRLLPMIESTNSYVSSYAGEILMKAGAKAAVILPDILRLSHSNNGTTRSIAASILGSVGDSRPEVVHRLNQLATERYSDSRRRAIQSLGQLGTGAKSATPTLVDIAANTSGTQEGYDAIWALIQINNSSPEVVSTLKAIHGKRGPSEQKRFAAVALVSLGEPAENFIRDLHYLLENDSAGARKFASIAATQMLTVDPEHQGAKALIAREEQNAKFNEAMKIEAQRRAESR